jgi:hypothetical protein
MMPLPQRELRGPTVVLTPAQLPAPIMAAYVNQSWIHRRAPEGIARSCPISVKLALSH